MSIAISGSDCKLYYNAASYETPSWQEVTNCRDLTLGLTSAEADASTRASFWATVARGLDSGTIDFEMVWLPEDGGFGAFLAAFLNRETIDVMVLDGDEGEPASQGLRAECHVLDFSRAEPLADTVKATVSLKPANTENPPEWIGQTT